jgi:hypothetical protein
VWGALSGSPPFRAWRERIARPLLRRLAVDADARRIDIAAAVLLGVVLLTLIRMAAGRPLASALLGDAAPVPPPPLGGRYGQRRPGSPGWTSLPPAASGSHFASFFGLPTSSLFTLALSMIGGTLGIPVMPLLFLWGW